MKKNLFIITLIIIFIAMIIQTISASDQDFQEGINLYNEKKIEQALDKFLQSEKYYQLNKKENQIIASRNRMVL